MTTFVNEIKNFKGDYKNIYSYIEKQLVYFYHLSSQHNDKDSKNLFKESVESISLICDDNDDKNDFSFSISILNSFKTFLIKKVEINENSNENSNNQLLSIDLGLLNIYKWIISGLFNKKLIKINYHKNQINSSQFSQLRELIETVLILSIKLLDIPEFLKTIEEQKQFNDEKEYIDSIKRSNLFRDRIIIIFEIIFQFFNSEIDKNNILNLEIKNTSLNQLFYRILEYKIINHDDNNNKNSDIISKHWTNLEISNFCNELLIKFQLYYSRKYEFITNLLEYYKWSRTTTELHFKLLGSLEGNENRWKYNSPYIHSFQMFIQSLKTTTPPPPSSLPSDDLLFEYLYTSSPIQSHRLILSIIYNLLDCTSNDIKFIGIDILNYLKLNFNNNNHFKSFLIIDNNNNNDNNNRDIYIKLFDIFKLFESVNQNDVFKCAHLLFDLLLILYPINLNNKNLIHPNIKIITNNNNSNNNNNNNLKEITIFNNNFKKYQDIIMLLISILVNQQQQEQKEIESIKKLIILKECNNRIFKELGLHCIQFFNLLIPSLLENLETCSIKSDQLLILEILNSLDEIINYCWLRIVNSNYSTDIINSISPLYNNNNKSSNVYNNIIISILDRLSFSFKKLNKFDKFISIFNNNNNNLKNNIDFFNLFIEKYNK
ncbi:hypothetical protein ACTFIY_001200 [Dictyostelium cf. discoideum]